MSNTLMERTIGITDRQRQVVELIAQGCSNDEVGSRLGISPRTAKARTITPNLSSQPRRWTGRGKFRQHVR